MVPPVSEDGFVAVNSREYYSVEVVQYLHDFLKQFFPMEDEMDPVDVWIDEMNPHPEPLEGQDVGQIECAINMLTPLMYAGMCFDTTKPCETPCPHTELSKYGTLIGCTIYEYYPLSNSVLLSYIAVDTEYRRSGIGMRLVREMQETLALKYQKSGEVLTFTAPKGEFESDVVSFLMRVARSHAIPGYDATRHSLLLQQYAKFFKPEDFTGDAVNNLNTSVIPIYAETNAVGVDDGIMDPTIRHKVLNRLGFELLDFDYIQPALGEGQGACYDLILLLLNNTAPHRSIQNGTTLKLIPKWMLKLFIIDFCVSCVGDLACLDDDETVHMVKDLATRPSALSLEPLPWVRRTKMHTKGGDHRA